MEENFIFYASYHNDKVNQAIHIVFVWPILISALVLLLHIPHSFTTVNVPSLTTTPVDINMCLLVAAYYALVYMYIELPGFAGCIASAMVVGSYFLANHIKDAHSENAFQLSLIVHVTSWVAQFYGHGVHEGRSPALLTNLYQALVMAPLFVLMEVLFMFGYRPNFRIKCQKLVDQNVEKFNSIAKKKAERLLR